MHNVVCQAVLVVSNKHPSTSGTLASAKGSVELAMCEHTLGQERVCVRACKCFSVYVRLRVCMCMLAVYVCICACCVFALQVAWHTRTDQLE